MTKKTLKIFTVILAVMLAFAVAGCTDKGNAGTTDVSLKTPGATVSNNGAVSETENYFYFVNGQVDAAADNEYGTPVKGSIAVVAKNNLAKSEIVVPKIISGEDYGAGIFVYGDYVYYGTTTTKKDADGKVATDVLEFQKAKLDGSGVEEILDVTGLDTEYRFVKNGENVYLLYVDGSAIYCVDVATKNTTTVSENASAYVWAENNDNASVAIVYTENVKKYADDEDSTENEAYNNVYAYKAGEAEGKVVLTGEMKYNGISSDATLSVTAIKAGYVFVKVTPANNTVNTAKTYAVKVADIYGFDYKNTKTNLTNVVLNDNVAAAYIVSLNEIYYVSGETIVKGSLLKSADTVVPVAKVGASVILGVDGGYVYYVADDSVIARVKMNETVIETEQTLTGVANISWFSAVMTGDYIFWSDSAEDGTQYMKALNYKTIVDGDFDVETEDDVTTSTLKKEKIVSLGIMTDDDIVYGFEARLSAFKEDCYDVNQKLNVRDEEGNLTLDANGKIYNADFAKMQAEYNALTSAQKKLISDEGVKTYDYFERALAANNILVKLDGYIEAKRINDTTKTDAEWKALAQEVKNGIDKILEADDGEDIMNLADGNLMWEYYDSTEGAYVTLLK